MRTSISHPLQIAVVQPFEGSGRIGITFCPGKVQPGNRMFGRTLRDFQVDRRRLILRGIMLSLIASSPAERRFASTDYILYNEQNYTLQEYMYALIDFGPFDPVEIGLVVRGYRAAAKFTYDRDAIVDDRFIVTYDRSGWLSEAGDRYPYTREVVNRFDALYFGEGADRRFLQSQHGRLASDARGY